MTKKDKTKSYAQWLTQNKSYPTYIPFGISDDGDIVKYELGFNAFLHFNAYPLSYYPVSVVLNCNLFQIGLQWEERIYCHDKISPHEFAKRVENKIYKKLLTIEKDSEPYVKLLKIYEKAKREYLKDLRGKLEHGY